MRQRERPEWKYDIRIKISKVFVEELKQKIAAIGGK